jgi:uncharacterized protein (TIGR02452 family)
MCSATTKPHTMDHSKRINVWQETRTYYSSHPFVNSQVFENEDLDFEKPATKKFAKTIVEISNRDCVEVAIDATHEGMRPLLLNMCSWFKPGGGVEKGAGAQEEDLFRRSNYFKHLDRRHYPLTTFRTILSRGVEFYRNSREFNYAPMKNKYRIDCVAAAAPKQPLLTSNGRFAAADAAVMRKKINLLCQIALKNSNDCLILSAWGCGAYGCPPEHVAQLFHEVLATYDGHFKKIVFAILDGTTSGIQTDNFKVFSRIYASG